MIEDRKLILLRPFKKFERDIYPITIIPVKPFIDDGAMFYIKYPSEVEVDKNENISWG